MPSHSNKKDAITAENIAFSYGNEKVFSDVSFVIPKGSLTVIIGPNGSGKTTLVKTLLGLLKPDRGEVRVFGKRPSDVRETMGYVPQRFTFEKTFPITVHEFISFVAPQKSKRSIKKHLEHLEIGHLIDKPLGTLSGGQLQRALISRATVHNPKILFLDEAVSGIDVEGEKSFYKLIEHLHRQHKFTVVMISHELNVAYSIADNVICFNRALVCSGSPQTSLTPDVLKSMYGSDVALYEHECKH